MMKEMKRVPKLRFPEFTDDWEQRKLGELIKNISTGKSVNSNDELVSDEDIAVLKTSCVSNDRFDSTECKRVIEGEVEFVKCPIKKDNVIVSRMNTPERVGACGYIAENHDNLFLPDRLWQLKFKEEVSAYYIYIMLISTAYKNEIRSMASGTSSSMYNIPQDRFLNLHMRITPSKAEQEAIGRYFSRLDHLITLHQRKLEKLKELKKGLVQKLFSQEVRFKADDGSEFPKWEEKKLGDVTSQYKVRNKKRLPLEIYSVNNIVGFIPQSEQFDDAGYLKDTDTSIYMVVPPKHFAYNPARLDIGSIGYQCLDHDVQVSSLYEVFETSDLVNDRFLWSWFHTYYFNNVVKRLQEGGVRLYFYYDKMQEVKIRLPSLPEQQKIADCLSSLDDGIAKQKATLAAWEELKKGLLQQMFV